jgi:hypothetical protein
MKKKVGPVWYLRNSFLLVVLISCTFQSVGQSFSKDREKFIKEASKVFLDDDMQHNVKDVFPAVISGNSLSDGNFNKMVDGANAIVELGYESRYAYWWLVMCILRKINSVLSFLILGLDWRSHFAQKTWKSMPNLSSFHTHYLGIRPCIKTMQPNGDLKDPWHGTQKNEFVLCAAMVS